MFDSIPSPFSFDLDLDIPISIRKGTRAYSTFLISYPLIDLIMKIRPSFLRWEKALKIIIVGGEGYTWIGALYKNNNRKIVELLKGNKPISTAGFSL